MIVLLYLLGFPTPVVELVLAGVLIFLITAVYVGVSFRGLNEADDVPAAVNVGGDTSSTNADGDTSSTNADGDTSTTNVEGPSP